jgi:NitT/TauT family transport system permease protein
MKEIFLLSRIKEISCIFGKVKYFTRPVSQKLAGFYYMNQTHSQGSSRNWLEVLAEHRILFLIVSLAAGVILWELFTRVTNLPPFILPPPSLVADRFVSVLRNGVLLRHLLYTLAEVLTGLALGVTTATLLGYGLAKSPVFEKLVSPYVVASQAIPIVAIAPLLVIWFGAGITSKVLICALIVFFPVLINTAVGIRSVPRDLHDLMRSLRATSLETIRFLEIPASMPVFLGGLRIGATLAVIGAVVGEFIGADRGLGFLINQARGQYDTALVFVAVITLIALALALYGIVVFLELHLTGWQKGEQRLLTS